MSVCIEHEFKFLKGTVFVELRDLYAKVVYLPLGHSEIVIEEVSGAVVDWSQLYQGDWLFLWGAALANVENRLARDYAISSISDFLCFCNDERVENEELVNE